MVVRCSSSEVYVVTPQQTVESFIAAWNRMDMERIYALMHPDIFYHNIPMQPARGHAEVRAVFAGFPAFDGVDWAVHAIAASGAMVLTERTDRFKIGDRWFSVRVMGTFEVQDGLIIQWRDYFDLAEFTGQLESLAGS
jgi:limonene-1,2-epoxide hydrolase